MSLLPLNTMLGRLNIVEVLAGEDEPCIFIAENAAGTRYVAFLADEHDGGSVWLYVAASDQRIDSLVLGQVDLRTIYAEPEDGMLFLVRLTEAAESAVEAVQPQNLEEDFLPPPDDFLVSADVAVEAAPNRLKKTGTLTHEVTIKRPRSHAPVPFESLAAVATNWSRLLHSVLESPPILAKISAGSLVVQLQTEAGPTLPEFLEQLDTLVEAPEPEKISERFDHLTCKRLELLLETLCQDKLTLAVKVPAKAESPTLVLSYLAVHDLRLALTDLNQQRVESTEVPQADDLSKLFKMLELIQAGEDNLTYHLSMSQRHVNYYKHAARILDFINEGGFLTSRGHYLLSLPVIDRYEVTMMFFESSPVGLAWLRYSKVKCALYLDPDTAETFLVSQCPNLASSTVGRRAQTLRYWVAAFKEKLPD